jgi:hypothetical protein
LNWLIVPGDEGETLTCSEAALPGTDRTTTAIRTRGSTFIVELMTLVGVVITDRLQHHHIMQNLIGSGTASVIFAYSLA